MLIGKLHAPLLWQSGDRTRIILISTEWVCDPHRVIVNIIFAWTNGEEQGCDEAIRNVQWMSWIQPWVGNQRESANGVAALATCAQPYRPASSTRAPAVLGPGRVCRSPSSGNHRASGVYPGSLHLLGRCARCTAGVCESPEPTDLSVSPTSETKKTTRTSQVWDVTIFNRPGARRGRVPKYTLISNQQHSKPFASGINP